MHCVVVVWWGGGGGGGGVTVLWLVASYWLVSQLSRSHKSPWSHWPGDTWIMLFAVFGPHWLVLMKTVGTDGAISGQLGTQRQNGLFYSERNGQMCLTGEKLGTFLGTTCDRHMTPPWQTINKTATHSGANILTRNSSSTTEHIFVGKQEAKSLFFVQHWNDWKSTSHMYTFCIPIYRFHKSMAQE